jgi:hypothetical protein
VSCPATGDCTATGDFGKSEEFVVGESAGTWADAQAITGLTGEYGSTNELACPSAGDCALGGDIYSAMPYPAPSPLPYIASEAGGSWGASDEISGLPPLSYLGALVTGVSCAAPGDCSIAGQYFPSSGKWVHFVVDETDGTWGPAQLVPGAAQLQI